MPIFSTTKFEVKTIPPRAKRPNINYPLIYEELNDLNNISLTLNNTTYEFHNGAWLQFVQQTNGNSTAYDENPSQITRKLHKTEEENNLKQLKIDILLDMLTENLNELHVLKKAQSEE